MSQITLQISGEPNAVAAFFKGLATPADEPAEPWWIGETPWFGELSPEEAADMEVGFYGKPKPHFWEVELTPERFERLEAHIRRAIRAAWDAAK